MEWRQEKDMPVFMYIFLNKIEDAEEARWTEKVMQKYISTTYI